MIIPLTYNDPAEHFVIDYTRVRENTPGSMWPTTRAIATRMSDTGMFPLPMFLNSLTDDEVGVLMECFDEYVSPGISPERHEEIGTNLMCMTLMLVQGEGLTVTSTEEADGMCRYLVTIVAYESLKRAGLVKINYENVTFGSDREDATIVEKI